MGLAGCQDEYRIKLVTGEGSTLQSLHLSFFLKIVTFFVKFQNAIRDVSQLVESFWF